MALQWEECRGEYRSKHALYFRLRQEIQDTNIKVKGLQQVRNFTRVMVSFCICAIFNGTSMVQKMCCSVCVLCLVSTPIS